ncbi:hypothetical protein LR48_Vigan317s001000 [Vigna angularis]|uniref:Uncharacterized protein n=1 Tax=Phaseolus angularis TaxID=3914 RepID=A0A0L9T9L5_PHAAN|nr:hypothetical protein LR48_Vigan317s001000 [Vigna angularis]
MKGDCYPELVEVFYNNLKVISGDIHSRVKGVDIIVIDDVWLLVTGLKAERCRYLRDGMSTEDLFLLNAIQRRIPTNWVPILKNHMINTGIKDERNLPYGVFIGKLLKLNQKTIDDWIFRDVQNPVRSLNNTEDCSTSFTPKSEFERYIVERFERTFKKIGKLENSLVRMENKVNELIKNYVDNSSTEISDDTDDSSEEETESIKEDS